MYAQQHCSIMDTEKLGTGNLGNGNREHPRSHIPSSSFLWLQSIKLVIIRQQQHWGLYIFGSNLQNECTDSTGVQNEFTRRCLETRYNSCLLVHLDFEERQQTRRSFLMNHYTKHQNHWSSESHSLTCLAFMKHPLIQYNTSVPKNQLKFDIFATCQFFTTIVTQFCPPNYESLLALAEGAFISATPKLCNAQFPKEIRCTQTFWNKACLDIFSFNILLSYLLVSFLIFIIWNVDITLFPTFSCR